jgi:Uma2 family endonuclease
LPLSEPGSPTWEIALNFPRQGEWTEEEYLSLGSNRLIEYSDGVLEFLPMPKPSHARISRYLSDLLRNHVASKNLGEVFWAPFSIRIAATRLREPDILFLSHDRIPDDDVPPDGADLVVEVVSEGNEHRFRDFNTKRSEYAAAGIPEYWIVDPANEVVLVLKLVDGSYQVHGEFRSGQIASSALLPGFEVDVNSLYQAAKSSPKPKEG